MSNCDTDIDFLKTLFNTWLNEKIQSGEVQPGLLDCEKRKIGQWSQVMLCCPGCGNDNGGNTVDKYLVAPVVINEAAKTMTFKIQNGDDIVVDVSAFLAAGGGAHEFSVDNTQIVFDTTQGTANKITLKYKEGNAEKTIDLPIIGILSVEPTDDKMGLKWVAAGKDGVALAEKTWTAPRSVIEQPTFDTTSRDLTIPIKHYVDGNLTDDSQLKVRIPGGSDNGPSTITPPGSGQTPKQVYYFHESTYRANKAGDAIAPGNKFDNSSAVREDTFYNSKGFSKTLEKLVANPVYITVGSSGSANGLMSTYLEQIFYDLATGTEKSSRQELVYAKLENPEIDAQGNLSIKLAQYTGSTKLNGSDQTVEVKLPQNVAKLATNAPASTTETDLPLKLYGKDRTALLANPDMWGEIVGSDGKTYVFPLFNRQ